jgi:hypothetical protein
MHHALEWLKKEIRESLETAVFFAVAFCLIDLADKLTVRGSDIEIPSFITAIVGGLIIAKILLVVDLFPFLNLFPSKPLMYNIIWKTLIYFAASLVYRYIEPLITFLFASTDVAAAHYHAVQKFTHPMFWAISIWIALLFAIFVTMQELSRALGKNKMPLLFFGR